MRNNDLETVAVLGRLILYVVDREYRKGYLYFL